MKNMSRHIGIVCELETSLLLMGIELRGMCLFFCMIGLVKHVVRGESFSFLYMLLLNVSKILASCQPTLCPSS